MGNALSDKELKLIDAYWRAANYLSVGQIYLFDNPLLKQPLKKEHIKPRLLGHWGTTPGLNFLYAHLNRVIKQRDLNMIYIIGPGHGGPAIVANAYMEGTYSEVYPNMSQDEEGMKRLFKQFSFPGGIPSHVAPETPGSIHASDDSDLRRELEIFLALSAMAEPMGYPGLAKVWHKRLGTFESVHSRVTDYDIAERHWAVMDLLDHIEQGTAEFRERIKQVV